MDVLTTSEMAGRRCLALAAVAALAVLLAAPAASGKPAIEIVELTDGSAYQGELVEKVPGDHVTIKLATGEIRRFDWLSVSDARDASSAAPVAAISPPAASETAGDLAPSETRSRLLPPGTGDQSAAPVLDWPEPDRTPPTMMASRLSLGLVGGWSPVGYGAIQAEYYPWDENGFTLGLHAAYGPWGALGPSVSQMLAVEWPMATWLQQGLGVGLTESFRDGPTALTARGLPDQVSFFDADCTHFTAYFSRSVLLRATMGFSFPVSSGCSIGGACGRFHAPADLDFTAALVWNFDVGPGGH